MGATPRLELEGMSKSFGSFRALRGVDLRVEPGEIHAVVGQNGSGKSTLVKILAGYHHPDRGCHVRVDGVEIPTPTRPRDLRAAGIAIVHQDFGLINEKTVAENIAVGHFTTTGWSRRVDWKAEYGRARALLDRLDAADIDPTQSVAELGPAARSIVAIARALRDQRTGGGLIVLDESTRALPKDALEDFYQVLRTVVRAGGAALMISHNLTEVLNVADRVTVFRDGEVVDGTHRVTEVTERDVARMMLGHTVDENTHRRAATAHVGIPIEIRGLTGKSVSSFGADIAAGQIVGLTGVVGAGWDEIPYLLAGAQRCRSGSVRTRTATVNLAKATSADCIKAGVALLPEHRIEHGLAITQTVAENITLPRVRRRGKRFFIGIDWQHTEVARMLKTLDVRPPWPNVPVGQLSGGNQQKVLLAKWLAGAPDLLILHEPTQAVDVGAREDILAAISATADTGISVLLASIQPSDLAAVCDRVLVFRDGAVIADVVTPTEDAIVEAVYASHSAHALVEG